jgi:hypothetical protein
MWIAALCMDDLGHILRRSWCSLQDLQNRFARKLWQEVMPVDKVSYKKNFLQGAISTWTSIKKML